MFADEDNTYDHPSIDDNNDLLDELVTSKDKSISDIYNISLKTGDWKHESKLPLFIDHALPTRAMYVDYFNEPRRTIRYGKETIEPECRLSYDVLGVCSIPRLYRPLVSLPIIINNSIHTMIYSDIDGIDGISESIKYLSNSGTSWYFSNTRLMQIDRNNVVMNRVISCYRFQPLHIFSDIAIHEIAQHPTGIEIWRRLFDNIEDFTRRPGIFGIIHDNSIIDIRPYDHDSEIINDSRNIEARLTQDHWSGFIDCTYTPMSLEAGRIRSVVHGCKYRVMTSITIKMAKSILNLVRSGIKFNTASNKNITAEDWIFYCCGKACIITAECAMDIVELWRSFRSHNAPSIHAFNSIRIMVMTVSSGCIMKPINAKYGLNDYNVWDNAMWVDSIVYNTPGMLEFMTGYKRLDTNNPFDNVKMGIHLIPFFLDDEPPRPALATSMSMQAICRPRVELTSTIAAKHEFLPVVRTPLMQSLIEAMPNRQYISIPGVPLLVVFANMKGNYEDSVIINKSINDLGLFAHASLVHHPVPDRVPVLKAGYKLTEKDKWFRPHANATVVKEGLSRSKARYVTVRMESSVIDIGDKLGTWHGQKFTVSSILSDDEMPTFICCRTNERIIPHIIVAATSVHNRGTLGQIYESWIGMQTVDNIRFDPSKNDKYVIIDSFDEQLPSMQQYSCYINNNDDNIMESFTNDDCKYVKADYGISHFWLLSHLARDKQHYMNEYPMSATPKKGKLRGSSVRFGEMETLSMMSGGLINSLSYLSDTSDLVNVTVCVKCRRLSLLCDCPTSHIDETNILVRNPLVRFDIFRSIYSANGITQIDDDSEIVRDESSIQLEGKHKSDPFIAESFKYYT
ncbi:hypothetical protein HK099_003897 [Clydaea vesicula]|uniref:DNA-directed RNA polymerase n=1 Tax=Clydaea vesicula TaxID=447962 RepID=A0AAD5U3W4_9FUNG|nr:hypothetical protein HK099_003897 [Clydaea vesicula]